MCLQNLVHEHNPLLRASGNGIRPNILSKKLPWPVGQSFKHSTFVKYYYRMQSSNKKNKQILKTLAQGLSLPDY